MQEYMYAGLEMQVPQGRRRGGWARGRRGRLVCVGVVALLGVMLQPVRAVAADKKPWAQISLDSLGFPGVSGPLLVSGSSVLTVNFVDSHRLLVTFELRKLVPRLAHDPEDHEDRLVGGEIVDLPGGKIEARTEWHMHDHGRYLWNLGEGRFLLRIGERLYTMTPGSPAKDGDGFTRTLFPSRPVKPSLVVVSGDGGVVTLETVYDAPEEDGRTKVVLGDEDTAESPNAKTVIDFFRIGTDGTGAVTVTPAGHLGAAAPVLLPVDADGYLWASQTLTGWAMTFDTFGGKTIKLGTIQSSCFPRLVMTSRSEFVALTCQGSDDRIKVASYGLDGTDAWEETVGDFELPGFAFAPAAGRFAMSGTSPTGDNEGTVLGGPYQGARQEVRVYQNGSGDLLLRVQCSPGFKTAENFDLSGDGMLAAVVRDGGISVYKLPPLTKKDRDDMAEIASYAPPTSTAEVKLARITTRARAQVTEMKVAANSLAATPVQPVAEAAKVVVEGDVQAGPRKRPTLLNPGEKPEFGSANPEERK
jgi:hypothetical protein